VKETCLRFTSPSGERKSYILITDPENCQFVLTLQKDRDKRMMRTLECLSETMKEKQGDANRCSHGVRFADRCFECDPNIGTENRD
jgi:hypothetical protein